ncbi:dihydrofolate reductase [Alicycliphilus denitrificans]|uniref:2-hydroxyacid dehydrogenase n=1 Tax=Alicycliphilus denitrificans TaxID=179636 RepID=A0A3R7IE03_9BURK|nr:2-hydroxyacid dehydrogenase [Alicycliphilus denitrificans]MEB2349774.1 2-hydroxyacid dehydrogenase [Comamonadaceae bacterium]OJW83786.1 MAG: hydroxyacid dehydrogenase [Alicycliphilus sp. 69-12]MBN9575583.1 2-hydroxyacid dehydrogenase [Alicycliphilus denitrificans]RKJ94184.1 2-hydroxyacid dehydrogenase [Alicycliphilus denitrificans]BCN38495.1 dihydrofolate reductase [Alicycliphilus denitrificans]
MNTTDALPVLATLALPPALLEAARAKGLELLGPLHQTDPAAFATRADGIAAVLASADAVVDAALMDQLPNLRLVSVIGVGYDGVDVAAARTRGVAVTHTPGVLDDDVADLALGLMLAVARQIPAADRFVREGRWPQGPMPVARRLSGARCGLVGMGRIGQAIAQRAAAFQMEIAYTARGPKSDLPYAFVPDVRALAGRSDVLVVVTPGGAATRHLIGADVLRALGPQGVLVNVARGSVVDEAALIEALEQGLIAGAGLDVFEDEPHVPERLRALPNAVLTPHVGSATAQTRQAMAGLALGNLVALRQGLPLLTPVPECRAGAAVC